ncbi:hypothetical protein PGTUg99_037320 [Puccinia graminis f. sp. tritici]|uniref:Uncharacterized protein n=4 Tax=Puccinia graminis f. sp. tritici TaxID=56615 RepID=E3K1R8_PUCGT|nr:uncharacterized protein PGTG_04199 [Puccinia graminis f. sp. tritici CRL 75-36-700-3]EFP78243.2 hypothetical protein PGTG_04199 [Puccinia graminis f. sp. tritici CRL 75-36-700-3]KAA1118502.1 hypothetical protein PGTUg99_011370 [Puccinia graminis f. sp. tritici]KAA1132128.1 hypothetical protein PGTUg99_037320 [Puccinia graminis f. sp. tritici]
MMDSDTASMETKRLILKAINDLQRAPHPELTRGGAVREISEKVFSRRKINAGTALLVQVQTRSLPALRRQLSGLVESLDMNTPENEHKPKLTDALEFANQLGPTLDLLENSIASLAPAIISGTLELSCKIDHEYGLLKRYKCIDLFQKFVHFTFQVSRDLFHTYWVYFQRCVSNPGRLTSPDDDYINSLRGEIFARTVEACRNIDVMIQSSKQSDISILRQWWQEHVDLLSARLSNLTRHIDYSVRLSEAESAEQDARRNNPGNRSDFQPSNDDDSVSETFSEEIRRLVNPAWGVPPDYQRNNPDGDGDDQSDFETHSPTSSQEEVRLNLDLLPHIRRTMPLLKLGRIFFRNLLNIATGKTPLTLSTSICSYDMACLKIQTGIFCTSILKIVGTTYRAEDEEDLQHQMQDISRWSKELLHEFDSSLMLLAFFLAPDPSRIDHPLPGDPFRSLFLELRCQLDLCRTTVGG